MIRKTFKNLTLCAAVYILAEPALADNRCVADLQRIQPQNCLSRDKQQHAYDWRLTDGSFGMLANACITDTSANGTHRDFIIGIDRSASNLVPDKQRKKLRADGISATIDLINQLAETYKSNPAHAPNVSLTVFSSHNLCREYQGGKISFLGEFPCLFVKPGRVTDELHRNALLELLNETEGKYSAGSTASASDFSIMSNLVRDGAVVGTDGHQAGMVLFSTGLSYQGAPADTFAFLKSDNYLTAQNGHLSSFSLDVVRKQKLTIVSAPLAIPYFGSEYRDSFENMCALPDRPSKDCAVASIEPAAWFVNKVDITGNLRALAAISGGSVLESSTAGVAEKISQQMIIQGQANIIPEKAVLLLNGQQTDLVELSGQQILLRDIPAGGKLDLRLEVYANGAMIPFSFDISTTVVEGASADFTDQEMFCRAETLDPAVADPELTFKDLQGGSGSCGVVGGKQSVFSTFFFLMCLPLIFVFAMRKNTASVGFFVVALVSIMAGRAVAEEKVSGLNSQHYKPVVDGVGNTESGTVMNAGTFNAGLYGDYANDPVEIGGEKGKRIRGVTDDMVTAHFTGNIGLFNRLSFGMHVPYVHKTDVEREIDGEQVEGGSLGQPADSAVFAKVGILTRSNWSLSFVPQATIPTGNSEYLIGDGTSSYGGLFAISGQSGGLTWASNLGYMHREKALKLADDRTTELKIVGYGLLSLGTQYRINGILSFGGNIFGKFHSGEKIDFTRTNPAEWQALGKMKVANSIEGSFGFGTGIGKGYGAPDYRVVAGLSYIPAVSKGTIRRIAAPRKK